MRARFGYAPNLPGTYRPVVPGSRTKRFACLPRGNSAKFIASSCFRAVRSAIRSRSFVLSRGVIARCEIMQMILPPPWTLAKMVCCFLPVKTRASAWIERVIMAREKSEDSPRRRRIQFTGTTRGVARSSSIVAKFHPRLIRFADSPGRGHAAESVYQIVAIESLH